MRVARPLPSMNGWAIFISTYLAIISSKVLSGIFSITGRITSKYRLFAKRNPPFAIFKFRILPAKSYNPSKRDLWIWHRPFIVPTSILSISPDSNRNCAFCKLCSSILWALLHSINMNLEVSYSIFRQKNQIRQKNLTRSNNSQNL